MNAITETPTLKLTSEQKKAFIELFWDIHGFIFERYDDDGTNTVVWREDGTPVYDVNDDIIRYDWFDDMTDYTDFIKEESVSDDYHARRRSLLKRGSNPPKG